MNDLEEMLDALDEHDHTFPYSVATLDVLATGTRLGRGVLTIGDHASLDELPRKLASNPLRVSRTSKLAVPFDLPELTLDPLSIGLVNAVIQSIQANAPPFGHYRELFLPTGQDRALESRLRTSRLSSVPVRHPVRG